MPLFPQTVKLSVEFFSRRDALLLSLVSTYVVRERLSVMHEPVGVVENLVQILRFTPTRTVHPPPEMKIVRESKSEGPSLHPPPPENEKCPEWYGKSENVGPSLPPPPENWKRENHTWRLNQYPRWVPSSFYF